jgi:polynucleotide 5'-hydroxyl-kinase GRC3/NOL9
VALRLGKSVAYLDADVGQSTVGPPATVGLRYLTQESDLEPLALGRADALYFVGSTSPQGHLLPLVVGAARLADQARTTGTDLLLVDTGGLIGGTLGQVLKFHKVEALGADWVVGFQRGEELEPILGAVRRGLPAEVEALPVPQGVRATTVDERTANRQARLREAFEPPLHRWKVKPSVFFPQVPPEIDVSSLDGLLVGMEDGKGECIGLGVLECRDEGLRMISSVAEGAKALRLGSVRVAPDFSTSRVDLRELFVSD